MAITPEESCLKVVGPNPLIHSMNTLKNTNQNFTVLDTFSGRFPLVVVTRGTNQSAFVVVSFVIAEFVALVAVVAVVAFPASAPVNVVPVVLPFEPSSVIFTAPAES